MVQALQDLPVCSSTVTLQDPTEHGGEKLKDSLLLCSLGSPYAVLPGGGKSSRLHFSKTTAILGRLTAKFFTHTACFLTCHGHF
jgi:hypothetical protein